MLVDSPRAILRACIESHLITIEEFKIFMDIIDDRNLSSHTYNEDLAEEISQRIPLYHELMVSVVQRTQKI